MKKVARIFYNWWGNANIRNRWWTLLNPEGEVEDYHTKKECIKTAKGNGWLYQVESYSKKYRNKMTILEKNF